MDDKALSSREAEMRFCAERGFAMAQYAYLEEALAYLFAHLMGVSEEVAGIPFFRINNARARLAMLERLLQKKYRSSYQMFWRSLERHLQALDTKRNQVVHWTTVVTHLPDGPVESLVPPNHWDTEDSSSRELRLADLIEFSDKCEFFTSVLSAFVYTLQGQQFVQPSWPEIFQRPVAYPSPVDHPLRKRRQRPPPPQSSSRQ